MKVFQTEHAITKMCDFSDSMTRPNPLSSQWQPLTFTFVLLQTISRRANASVGAIQVLTGSRCTLTRIQNTFIDICREKRVGERLLLA